MRASSFLSERAWNSLISAISSATRACSSRNRLSVFVSHWFGLLDGKDNRLILITVSASSYNID